MKANESGRIGKGVSVIFEFDEDLKNSVYGMLKLFFANIIDIYEIHVEVYAYKTMIRNY